MKRFAFVAILAAILAAAATAAYADDALQITDMRGLVEPGGVTGYITGIATNTSGKRIDSATVTIQLLDANGAIIGTTSASTAAIAPGQQWKFRAPTTMTYERSVVATVTTH
jgi:hypothetical protein